MLLSIGMIVKNEEKYLGQCLEALTSILKQVDSELIIADTGSTDTTVEIARHFTDNVIHFAWRDDFSAARNATLERARGEWYMYIDADEILDDCTDIIHFFNSGEYKKYNSASINITSHNNAQMDSGVFAAWRLYRRYNDLRFEKPIHEALTPHREPQKKLNANATHYGYVMENNQEFIQKKADRNLKIMLDLEKKYPDDVENLYYISQSYILAGDLQAALEYCDKSMKIATKQQLHLLYSIYFSQMIIYCSMEPPQCEKALSVISEYFLLKKEILATDLEMYAMKGECHFRLKEFAEAIEAYENYRRLYWEFKEGKHHTLDMNQHAISFTDENSYQKFMSKLEQLQIVHQADMLFSDLESGVSIDFLAQKTDPFDLVRALGNMTFMHPEWPRLLGKINPEQAITSSNTALWVGFLLQNALASDILTIDEKKNYFVTGAISFKKYFQAIYTMNTFSEEKISLIPPVLRFGFLSNLAIDYILKGETAGYIRCLRLILKQAPELNSLIQSFLADFTKN